MARLWATILKELNTERTAEEFRGPGIKGPTGKGYANTGTAGTDFIVPDIEQDALTINDTNNAYPIVSYGSNGGVRHLPVVGYAVGGSYMTKLYREQAEFLFDAALRKKSETNPLGDLPSFQIDYCYWDSDPIDPRLVADSYKGVKFGAFGLTAGAASPIVTCMFQLVGSTCTPITVTNDVPAYGREHACDGYPNDVFTFKDVAIYADFDGNPLWTGTPKDWTPPPDAKKLLTVRSISLNFLNTLATASHNDGIVDRIQRTVQALQYSLVVDLVDPDAAGTEDDFGGTAYGSQVWREKYRALRTSVEEGKLALGVTITREDVMRISIDLGSRSVIEGYQSIKPIPDIFAAQINGFAMFDPSNCNTYDWNIADISGA